MVVLEAGAVEANDDGREGCVAARARNRLASSLGLSLSLTPKAVAL